MAHPSVIAAVAARLASGWSHCVVADVDNAAATPPAVPFLAAEFPVANENQITIGAPGANVFRETGAIRLVLAVDKGSGGAEWRQWMEDLRGLFRGTQFGGVSTWAPSSPVLDDRNQDGGFYKLSIAVPYYFDFIA